MKLFFTILAAILAAAAVIWCVIAYRASEVKKSNDDRNYFVLVAKNAQSAIELATLHDIYNVSDIGRKIELDTPTYMLKRINNRRVPLHEVRKHIWDYIYYTTEHLKWLKTNRSQHAKWANDLEENLTPLKSAIGYTD